MSEAVQAQVSEPMHAVAIHVTNAVMATKAAVEKAGMQAPLLAQAERLAAALETERVTVLSGKRNPADWIEGAKTALEQVRMTLGELSQRNMPQPQIDSILQAAKATLAQVEAQLNPNGSPLMFLLGTAAVGALGWWAYASMSKGKSNSFSDPEEALDGDPEEALDGDDDDSRGIERVKPLKRRKSKNAEEFELQEE